MTGAATLGSADADALFMPDAGESNMAEREAEDWLLRYLVVMVVAATALLALIYGVALDPSMSVTAVAVLALAATVVVVSRDLSRWRSL